MDTEVRLMRALRVLVLTIAVALGGVVGAGGTAYAGETPGTYSDWAFDGVSGLGDVAYTITVEQHPGQQSQIYWSNQVGWANGHGGYAGMQTNADPSRNLFLFSVWDVTEARVGSAGSWCEPFGGEGEGMSCRIWKAWTAGHTYEFHYRAEGSGWWGMTITDRYDGSSFKLGSIRVGSDLMNPTSVSWVEYYRWSDSRSSCATEPYSRATFGLPIGNNGTLTARVASTSVHGCPGFPSNGATVTTGSYGARHTLAIGNSVMGPVTGLAGKCLATQGSAVRVASCDGSAGQRWTVQNGAVQNVASGNCLDVEDGASADGTNVIQYACHGGTNQHWTTPVKP